MSFSSKFPIPFFKHPVSLISALIYDCDLAKRKKSSKVQQGQMALIKTLRRKSLLPKVRLDTPGAQSRSFADVLRIGRSWGCRGYRGGGCVEGSFQALLGGDSGAGVFLWVLRSFWEQLWCSYIFFFFSCVGTKPLHWREHL